MVAGHHLIWTAYGWWLPNDPRGSSSHEIRVERIADLGELHYGPKQVQPRSAELRRFYDDARRALRHELLTFRDDEIALLAESFGQVIAARQYTCYGCAIMPDHVHCLIRKHRDQAEQMIEALQNASRQALIEAGRRPARHPVWGGPGWKVFQNTREDMERIVNYIRENPVKAGRRAQQWEFVKDYDGWLPWRDQGEPGLRFARSRLPEGARNVNARNDKQDKQGALTYTVGATFDDPARAAAWLRWLRDGHIAAVRAGGAADAEIVQLDGHPASYEVRYHFPSRDAFARYEQDHAPRLRADGLRLFPPDQGIAYRRAVGTVLDAF